MNPRSIHIRHIHLKVDMNNNKMERWNGSFRDRERVTRGLKKTDSVMFDGYSIYHNYIKEHMGLNGKTPAQVCGIEIKGNDTKNEQGNPTIVDRMYVSVEMLHCILLIRDIKYPVN